MSKRSAARAIEAKAGRKTPCAKKSGHQKPVDRKPADRKPAAQQTNDDAPTDMDALRTRMAWRLHQLISTALRRWRTCSNAGCKRKRACAATKDCINPGPTPQIADPRVVARNLAMIHRVIRERAAQADAEQAAAELAASQEAASRAPKRVRSPKKS